MIIVLTFFLNAVLNFATGLAVAAVLGPADYGQFAIASMIAIVLGTSAFDWLRLSATRYYNEKTRANEPDLRASLDLAYLIGGSLFAAAAAIVAIFHLSPWLPAMLLVTVFAVGFTNGQFEYWAALARARFLDKTYAVLVICKNALALIAMVGAGLLFHTAAAVLVASALSVVLSIAPVWRGLSDRNARLASARWSRIAVFARYGVPIVIANVLYQVIILINRWVIAAKLGYAEAGQLSLATDLGIRIFLSCGAGFDLLLFQIAVRKEALHGAAVARAQIARNIVFIAAILIPLAGGYAATLPFFERLLVPAAYRGDFANISLALIPGVLGFSIAQFAFNPVFQLAQKTHATVWIAGTALFFDVVLLALLPTDSGPIAYASVHSASLLLASLVAAVLAFRTRDYSPRLRDLAAILIGTALMILVIWPLRFLSPAWLGLMGSVMLGGLVYAGVVIFCNVAEFRNLLKFESKGISKMMGRLGR